MKIEINKYNELELTEVYNGLKLVTDIGEEFSICMRDGGFEFFYGGKWFSAQKGKIEEL